MTNSLRIQTIGPVNSSPPGPADSQPAAADEADATAEATAENDTAAENQAADTAANIVVETAEQLHAVGNLVRQRILRVLRDTPSTVTQVAKYLGVTKGNAGYHMKVLAEAGFVRVVDTRKVRGVTELYYGPVGKLVVWPGTGGPDHLARLALAEIEDAPGGSPGVGGLRFLRLSPVDFGAASAKLHALYDEICALHDQEQPAAAFYFALFRPQDLTRASADPKYGA